MSMTDCIKQQKGRRREERVGGEEGRRGEGKRKGGVGRGVERGV